MTRAEAIALVRRACNALELEPSLYNGNRAIIVDDARHCKFCLIGAAAALAAGQGRREVRRLAWDIEVALGFATGHRIFCYGGRDRIVSGTVPLADHIAFARAALANLEAET